MRRRHLLALLVIARGPAPARQRRRVALQAQAAAQEAAEAAEDGRPRYIQLDPLRIIKNFSDPTLKVGPNIIIAMDTSMRMQYHFDGWYYDERSMTDASGTARQKSRPAGRGDEPRRVGVRRATTAGEFKNLVRTEVNQRTTSRYDAETIAGRRRQARRLPDLLRPVAAWAWRATACYQSVVENMYVANFGLRRMRHGVQDALPDKPGNESPVYLLEPRPEGPAEATSGNKTWKTTLVHRQDAQRRRPARRQPYLRVKVIEKPRASSEDRVLHDASRSTTTTRARRWCRRGATRRRSRTRR